MMVDEMADNFSSLEEEEEYATFMAMRFKSENDGFTFYNRYAKGKGFSIRKNFARRDPVTADVIFRQYTCSREGYRRDVYMDIGNKSREPRALTRCGCKAIFEIRLDKKQGDWFVVKFVAKHSHSLAKSDEVPFLRSHRNISIAQKANVVELREVGLRQHQVMDVMERRHGGFESTGFVSRDLYNFFVRQKKKQILGGDADHVIKYMQARQKDDMEYFFEYETDEAGRLKRLFWADPQSRIDYDAFGDVVVFDSTYRVNKYNLPFIPFVGVNHHGSTVIFACAIVADEKVASYEWILKQFLDCMGQKHPRGLITDGDNSMRRAISSVMPHSEHRLCTWHIEQNMARHLRPEMLADFRALIHCTYGPEEFENKWVEFKDKHKVGEDNQWLVRMYNLRKKWAAAYLKGKYFLGMKSNQRSESLNSKLHKHLDRTMSLVVLVEHYEHCVSRIRRREAELDSKASQSVPFTCTDASLIEKEVARIYTPAIFKKVKFEIIKSMDWEVIDFIDEDTVVKYVMCLKENNEKLKILNCTYEESFLKTMSCPCMKLDCESLPCQHMFAVLFYLKMDAIPESCIVRRWTVKAKSVFPSDRYGETFSWSDQMERYRMLRSFGSEVLMKCSISEECTLKVMEMLEKLDLETEDCDGNEIERTLCGDVVGQSLRTDISGHVLVHDPMEVVPKGAPRKRLRGFLEKRVRRCGYCRNGGHTIRSCPIYER